MNLDDLYPDVRLVENDVYSFDVRSRSNPLRWHRVNIREYRWGGWCNCEAYTFSKEPVLTRGGPPIDKNRCYHIKRARSYFMDAMLPKIDAELNRVWKQKGLKVA